MKNVKTFAAMISIISTSAMASICDSLPNHQEVEAALKSVVNPVSKEINGGLELNMWASIVARDGTVCVVAKTGKNAGDQWPGSRVISAQKANTANAFSLPNLALSTANLWKATQPGGSLFGLQLSNPVNINVAYQGEAKNYGTKHDPMISEKIGGVNVFGGGLALYDKNGKILGGLGVSGDTSCADHNIAWKTRNALNLDFIPAGVSSTKDDNIIYQSENGFSHPECSGTENIIAAKLPETHPIN